MKNIKPGDQLVCIIDGQNWPVDDGKGRIETNPGPVVGEICTVSVVGVSLSHDRTVYGLEGYTYGSNMKPIYYMSEYFAKVIKPKAKSNNLVKELT